MPRPVAHPSSTSITPSKTAIVTGAGSGLGRAISLQLGQQGWHVAVTDVDLAAAKRVADEISSAGGRALAVCLDVTRRGRLEAPPLPT